MASSKQILSANLRARLAAPGQPPLEYAQAVTALVRRGIKTGNAQRILDDTSSPTLKTIDDAAKALRTTVADLLRPASAASAQQATPELKLAEAIPVVLEAIAACPERDELRQLLPLLVTGAHGYRERITELLTGAEVAPGGRSAAA